MAGFLRKKVTGPCRPDSAPHHGAGGAVDAARQIDSDNRELAPLIASISRAPRRRRARSSPAPNRASTIMARPKSDCGGDRVVPSAGWRQARRL